MGCAAGQCNKHLPHRLFCCDMALPPGKAEQPLQGMELQEREDKKD